jgi:PAS domain S-box-containing protein
MDFSWDLYGFIFDYAAEGIFQSTPQGHFLRVNQAMAKIYGYDSPQDMVDSVADISLQIQVSPKMRDEFQKALREQGAIEGFESQNKRKDGAVIWTSTNAKAMYDSQGNILYYFGFVQDITAIKQAEHALGETETRYQTLVEQLPAAVYIDAPTDNLNSGIYISPQIKTISGYSPSEWTQTRGFWPSIIHPEDLERFTKENTRTNETGEPFDVEYRIIHKNGSPVWVRDVATLTRDVDGSPMYWHGILIDITEQKHFHDSLRLSEDRFRKVFEASPIAICITNLESGEFMDVNESYLRLSGCRREEIIGHTAVEMGFTSMEERAAWIEQFLTAGESIHRLEAKFKTATGEIRKTLDFYETIEVGGRKAILAMFYDTTAQSKVAEALRESEEQYRMLIEQASDGIIITDVNGKLLEVNPFGCALLGYTRDELLKVNFFEIMEHDKLSDKPITLLDMQIGDARTIECHLIRKDGSSLPVEISAKILPDGHLQGIVRDITERRKASDAQERQFKELSVLHALAIAGTRARNEDELIDQATEIIGYTLYPDILGIMLVTDSGDKFHPHPSFRGVTLPNLMREFKLGEGVTGQVAKTGKSMNVADVRGADNYIEINPNSRSELCVPMMIGDRVIGVINAESSIVGYFTGDDERLLLTVAGQLATAIERLRSEQAEREQRNLAEALRNIAETLNSTLEFNKVLDRILENIGRVVPSQAAMIMLLENGIARCIRHRGYLEYNLDEWVDTLRISCEDVPDFRRALKTRRPQLIPDTQNDPEWALIPETNWIRSHLLAPILTDKAVLGFISLDHTTPDFFTKRDEERLLAFTTQAAIALENARLFQEESRRAKIIEALAEIANVIATSRDIKVTLDDIAQRSLSLLNASHTAIYLLQDDEQTLKIIAAQGSYMEELLSHSLRIGQGITGNIVATGKAEIIDDTSTDLRRRVVPGTPENESEKETMMSVPLTLRDKTIGAINAWRLRKDGLFVQSELNFLASIAHQASIAIESGRLFEETVRRTQQTAAIAEVGRDISSTLELNIVLERIAVYAKELLNSETSAVYLAESPQTLRAIAAIGKDAEEIKSDPILPGSGILGKIANQRMGEIVNNATTDPRAEIIKGTVSDPFEHLMAVPVFSKDQLTGLLAIWRTGSEKKFKPTELDFLIGLAQQAAIAIENARLFQAEQQRRHEAETLREASGVVATTLDSGLAVELILDQLARVLQYDSAAVQLLRDGYLEIVGGRGWSAESAVLGMRFPVPGDNPNSTVVLERKPVILSHTRGTHFPFQAPPHSHIQSWMGVPLIARGEVIGMLSVDSKETDHFNEEHIRLVTAFANQAAIAIENARLHEKTEGQIQRLTALRDVDTAIASSLDLRVTLNILLDHAMSQLDADAMDVMIYNSNMQILELVAGIGFITHTMRRQNRIGEGLAGKIAISRKMLQVHNLAETPEFSKIGWLADEKFASYAGFPLLGKGQIKGVFEAFFRTPYSPNADWLDFMQTLAGQAAIAIDNSQLFENLQRSNQELSLAYDTTLEGWGKALELRDKETQGHTRRVTEMTIRLARKMGISDAEITHIRRGVLLHDIGKMGVPDHILRKTDTLDDFEWEQMRLHPQYAFELLNPIAYLRPALDIPYCHHEKWDGTGYPRGLKETEIPLSARIFSVVDVWDALRSERPYRESWEKEKTLEYIRSEAKTRFDPEVVRVFLEMVSEEK